MNLIKLIKPIFAQSPVTLGPLRGEGPLGLVGKSPSDGGKLLTSALSAVVGLMTFTAGIWFIIQIIVAGYIFITAGGDSQKIQEAQKKIVNSVIGIAVTTASVSFLSLMGHMFHVEFLDIENIIKRLSP